MNHICYPCFPCYLRDLIVNVKVIVKVEGVRCLPPRAPQTAPPAFKDNTPCL